MSAVGDWSVRKLKERKEKMAYARRKTYSNALKRWKEESTSEEFKKFAAVKLSEKLEMIKDDYAGFVQEHQSLVETLPKAQFKAQDEYFKAMSELYQGVIITFRKRINAVEVQELLKSQKKRASANDIESKEDMSENECEQEESESNMPRSPKERLDSVVTRGNREPLNQMMDLRWKLNKKQQRRTFDDTRAKKWSCHFCSGQHKVFDCGALWRMAWKERKRQIRHHRLCINCLIPLHESIEHKCKSRHCRRCGPNEFHNSMLCPYGFRK